MKKLPIIVFIALFFFFSLVPLFKIDAKSAVSKENRKLAIFPDNIISKKFPKQFEAYLNDRFGFRFKFAEVYKKFLYYGLKITPNRGGIIYGNNDTIILKGEFEPFFYLKNDNQVIKEFLKIQKLYEQLKKTVYILGVPLSCSLRPNVLPRYFTEKYDMKKVYEPWMERMADGSIFNGRNQTDEEKSLQNFKEEKFKFPMGEARELNQKTELYPSRNFHWVKFSPFTDLFAKIMVEHVAKSENLEPTALLPQYELSDYNERCELTSDISYLMGWQIENKPFYCRKNADASLKVAKISRHCEKMINHGSYYLDKKLLIVGDSFAPMFSYTIAPYFKETAYIDPIHSDDKELAVIRNALKKDFTPDVIMVVTCRPTIVENDGKLARGLVGRIYTSLQQIIGKKK